MFEGQPKGLYALALANTGERFGYYTMLAIFTLFLQAKFGFTAAETSTIFGSFLAAVYFMPLIGGILADKFGYGKMVTTGIVVMFIGYVLLSIPTPSSTGKILMFGALALIACGTGLFKGNLQVMVGNLYDAPEYKAKRDTAFSIFYMAINIGAMYAPTAATMITNKMLGKAGFTYVPQLPSLAHQFLNGTITEEGATTLSGLQAAQNFVGDTATFCTTYIDKLSEAYNYGFAIACISLIVSMLIYVVFRPTFKHADYNSKQAKPANVQEEELTPEQTKARIQALLLVFAVVIFFWMAFHQNGLTLTFFARDYTAQAVTGLDRLGFNIVNLTFLLVVVYAGFSLFQSKTGKAKGISGLVLVIMLGLLGWSYSSMDSTVSILPQIFQQFHRGHAPAGQLVFQRPLSGCPTPEQHHGCVILADHHRRAVGTAHKVDVHHIPAQGVAHANGKGCRQQKARHSHPQPYLPEMCQPAQSHQQQTNKGCIVCVKIQPRPRLGADPHGPAIQQAGQKFRRFANHRI